MTFVWCVWLGFLRLWRVLVKWWSGGTFVYRYGWKRKPSPQPFRAHPKPAWIRYEIIRLKAVMPQAGCRTIAHCFNRRFAVSRRMTVGKTYVAYTIKKQQYAILAARRKLKHAVPLPLPRNLIWGLDLTEKTDMQGRRHLILAILDHASRACLTLQALTDKSALTLVHHLLGRMKSYGMPKCVRTDNEPVLTARLIQLSLWLLGIRHQRTGPGCPWQNGRVERFLGTVKATLDQWQVDSREELDQALGQVRIYYNHVRPHQHLQGRTPAEAWAGIDVFSRTPKSTHWIEMWEGLLLGHYLRTQQ